MHKAIHYTQESFLNSRAISSLALGRVRKSNIRAQKRGILSGNNNLGVFCSTLTFPFERPGRHILIDYNNDDNYH